MVGIPSLDVVKLWSWIKRASIFLLTSYVSLAIAIAVAARYAISALVDALATWVFPNIDLPSISLDLASDVHSVDGVFDLFCYTLNAAAAKDVISMILHFLPWFIPIYIGFRVSLWLVCWRAYLRVAIGNDIKQKMP